MCTLIVIHRHVRGAPLLVAANRDEYFDRPAAGLEVWTSDRWGRVLAPRDLRAGGTWLGLNEDGIFAALTNRPVASPDPGRQTRGDLVLEALQGKDAATAAERMAELPSGTFNPFNLLVADVNRAFVISYEERVVAKRELGPGAHVIGNADPNDRSHRKTARILAEAEAAAQQPADEALESLAQICRSHGAEADGQGPKGPTDDACIHLGDRVGGGYGTRSSLLLTLSGTGLGSKTKQDNDTRRVSDEVQLDAGMDVLRYADGAPCEQPYRDVTALLHELSQMAGYQRGEIPVRNAS